MAPHESQRQCRGGWSRKSEKGSLKISCDLRCMYVSLNYLYTMASVQRIWIYAVESLILIIDNELARWYCETLFGYYDSVLKRTPQVEYSFEAVTESSYILERKYAEGDSGINRSRV